MSELHFVGPAIVPRHAQLSELGSDNAVLAQEAFYATGNTPPPPPTLHPTPPPHSPPIRTSVATGTLPLPARCNGRWALDGGVTNNKPFFTDGVRRQLWVRPGRAVNLSRFSPPLYHMSHMSHLPCCPCFLIALTLF